MEVLYKREDGSFVAKVNGLPYHIVSSDPLFTMAQEFGGNAPLDPQPVEPTPEELLTQERATMACTPMQGILALGEANWNTILAYRDTASWQEKVIIDSAQTWVRNSQNIAFFQYLLGFTDTQVDDLFRAATLIDA